eukprot:TRINITY_DN30207_c0_g1_i9.p1 TRINITY_DN30207_c0_g1~~TRINITY_DN30207_c0_g1_i9.p1  ORF type:complete len:747 (-),score=240.74 TRINITY_DN30207_c0_g1_i9:43-2283(-)
MTIPSMEEVKGWDVDQVQDYLKQTGLSDCCDILMRKQVDGLALLGMNDAVLQLWSRDMKIMQIKKLSKLVSQLNTTTMPASSISYSPAVVRQRKDRKVSQGSVAASSDNDWGSDFDDANEAVKDATETVKNMKISAPEVLKATPETSKVGKNVENTKVYSKPKISSNQVPKPYKPPSSNFKSGKVHHFQSSPEYSNVKKASLALNKSAVSAKISKFSSHDEKPTASTRPENHNTSSSMKQVIKSKSSITTSIQSKSSLKTIDKSKSSNKEVDNSRGLVRKIENSNSSINKVDNSNTSMNKIDNSSSSARKVVGSNSSVKKVEKLNSSMKSFNSSKSSFKDMNNSKKAANSNSFIAAKNSAFSREVTKKSPNTLQKEIKPNQMQSNGSPTKVEAHNGSVINKSKPPHVKNIQNQARKLSEASNIKSSGASKLELQPDSPDPSQNSVPSDKPAFIVHVDRSSQKKDCQVKVKESPVFSKTTEKEDTKEESEAACDITIKNVKTSDNFVKNNISYATVKTTKISSLAKSADQHEQPAKASKFPQRALPLTPPEESACPQPVQSISSLLTIPTQPPHTIWTPFSSSNSLPVTQIDDIAQNNCTIPIKSENPNTCIWSTSPRKTSSPSTTLTSPLSAYPWYQSIDRRRAEQLIKQLNRDGGFVVRDSKHGGADSLYTLTVHNNNKVFNINIRIRPDGVIALGKEKLEENTYPSVVTMVEHHQLEPLKLTAGDSGTEHSKTTLNYWPKKMLF